MDINAVIKGLEEITGLEVYQDIYEGRRTSFITFTYQDERPVLMADNMAVADQCDIYVHLYTPPYADYIGTKHQIRNYLEQHDFYVTMQSWVEDLDEQSNKKIRNTTFDCRYSAPRQEG